MATAAQLTGTEYVMVAQVPKAGGRWHQVHFNVAVGKEFFRVTVGETHTLRLEWIDHAGKARSQMTRPLVFSHKNRNYRVEFDFDVEDYPAANRPLLLILELGLRRFRYLLLMPGDVGYDGMNELNERLPSVGKGVRRVITNLDEVELAWPSCPLRGQAASTELDES
jgi:hypothetical protein